MQVLSPFAAGLIFYQNSNGMLHNNLKGLKNGV